MAAPAATVAKPYQTSSNACQGHWATGLYSIGFAKQNLSALGQHPAILAWLDYGNPPADGCNVGGPLADSTGAVLGSICGAPTKIHFQLYTDPATGENLYLPTGVYGPTKDPTSGQFVELTVCEAHIPLGFREISSNNGNFDVLFDYDEAGVCCFCAQAPNGPVPHSKYHLKLWTTRHYGPSPVL